MPVFCLNALIISSAMGAIRGALESALIFEKGTFHFSQNHKSSSLYIIPLEKWLSLLIIIWLVIIPEFLDQTSGWRKTDFRQTFPVLIRIIYIYLFMTKFIRNNITLHICNFFWKFLKTSIGCRLSCINRVLIFGYLCLYRTESQNHGES